MHQIEIIGMRKNRDLKIVITIIVMAIIGIVVCLGIIFYNKINSNKALSTNANVKNEANFENSTVSADNEIKNDVTVGADEFDEKEFIKTIDNIYNGEEGKRVFLTFDDGPSKEVTPQILDVLNKYNVKATFFVLGNRVNMYPDIVKRANEEGHYIANHGYSHKYSSIYKSVDSIKQEYNKTEEAIRKALNNPNYSSHLFRFPGGSHGGPYEEIKKEARKKLEEDGIAYLDWSALTYDAIGVDKTEDILKNLKETLNGWDNVVLLMHDAPDKKITYESLDEVIEYLKKEGYKFENIYDLI